MIIGSIADAALVAVLQRVERFRNRLSLVEMARVVTGQSRYHGHSTGTARASTSRVMPKPVSGLIRPRNDNHSRRRQTTAVIA